MGGSGPSSTTWFPGSTWVLNPNCVSIGSAVFAGLTNVTDHATRSVTIDRIYVCSTAMRYNSDNNSRTMFVVLSSWPWSLREFTQFIWWMQTERQVAANPQTKSSDSECESANKCLLPSTSTIAIPNDQCRNLQQCYIMCLFYIGSPSNRQQ